MKKDDIERLINLVNHCKNNKECQEIGLCSDCYIDLEEIQAIEKLLNENKELQEKIYRQQEQLRIANNKILAQRGQLKVFNIKNN